jgi:hypothetical protein
MRLEPARRTTARTEPAALPPYGHGTLAAGIRSRMIANVNGLTVHMLEAGHETAGRGPPCCSCTASPSSPTAGAR